MSVLKRAVVEHASFTLGNSRLCVLQTCSSLLCLAVSVVHAMSRLDSNRVKTNLIGQSANQASLSVFPWLGSYKAFCHVHRAEINYHF